MQRPLLLYLQRTKPCTRIHLARTEWRSCRGMISTSTYLLRHTMTRLQTSRLRSTTWILASSALRTCSTPKRYLATGFELSSTLLEAGRTGSVIVTTWRLGLWTRFHVAGMGSLCRGLALVIMPKSFRCALRVSDSPLSCQGLQKHHGEGKTVAIYALGMI